MDEDASSSKHWTTHRHMPSHAIFSSKTLHVTSSTEVTCLIEDSGSRRTFRCPLRSEESPSTISSSYNKLSLADPLPEGDEHTLKETVSSGLEGSLPGHVLS